MKLFFGLLAMLLGINFAQSADAQTATYNITLQNSAPFVIYGDYDPPVTTGGMPGVWFPAGSIGPNGGTSNAQITVPAGLSAPSSTFYSGTTDVAPRPYYSHEYECKFTITPGDIGANNACTAPNVTPAVTYGLGTGKPSCNLVSI